MPSRLEFFSLLQWWGESWVNVTSSLSHTHTFPPVQVLHISHVRYSWRTGPFGTGFFQADNMYISGRVITESSLSKLPPQGTKICATIFTPWKQSVQVLVLHSSWLWDLWETDDAFFTCVIRQHTYLYSLRTPRAGLECLPPFEMVSVVPALVLNGSDRIYSTFIPSENGNMIWSAGVIS